MRGRGRRARCIGFNPRFTCFKPCGVRGSALDTLSLRIDELEALRLLDYEGLYQEECAQRMGISRTTFSRMVAEAHRKVADALLHGKRLLIATESVGRAVGGVDGAERPGAAEDELRPGERPSGEPPAREPPSGEPRPREPQPGEPGVTTESPPAPPAQG